MRRPPFFRGGVPGGTNLASVFAETVKGEFRKLEKSNIFADRPADLPVEAIELLAGSPSVKIERIISRGHRSTDDFWYDQEQNEWVLLLKGRAGMTFAGSPACFELVAGDYLNIPAHVRHRVEWTADDEETIWLAVFY